MDQNAWLKLQAVYINSPENVRRPLLQAVIDLLDSWIESIDKGWHIVEVVSSEERDRMALTKCDYEKMKYSLNTLLHPPPKKEGDTEEA